MNIKKWLVSAVTLTFALGTAGALTACTGDVTREEIDKIKAEQTALEEEHATLQAQ